MLILPVCSTLKAFKSKLTFVSVKVFAISWLGSAVLLDGSVAGTIGFAGVLFEVPGFVRLSAGTVFDGGNNS
jgi:hypothetical protein